MMFRKLTKCVTALKDNLTKEEETQKGKSSTHSVHLDWYIGQNGYLYSEGFEQAVSVAGKRKESSRYSSSKHTLCTLSLVRQGKTEDPRLWRPPWGASRPTPSRMTSFILANCCCSSSWQEGIKEPIKTPFRVALWYLNDRRKGINYTSFVFRRRQMLIMSLPRFNTSDGHLSHSLSHNSHILFKPFWQPLHIIISSLSR